MPSFKHKPILIGGAAAPDQGGGGVVAPAVSLKTHIVFSPYKNGTAEDGRIVFKPAWEEGYNWMGISYNQRSAAYSQNPTHYQWINIIPPSQAKPVEKLYTHIVFSNYVNGIDNNGNSSINNVSGRYMGVLTNSIFDVPPQNAGLYRWVRVKGDAGIDGNDGIDGIDGESKYFHMVFSDYSDGKDRAGNPDFKHHGEANFLGYITNSDAVNPPDDPDEYSWIKVGKTGKRGKDGKDGIKINLKGDVATYQDLAKLSNVDVNDAYVCRDTYHLWVLGTQPSTELINWIDFGKLTANVGVNLKGTVKTSADLVNLDYVDIDDGYITEDNYHLWVLKKLPSKNISNWVDFGRIRGKDGKSGKDGKDGRDGKGIDLNIKGEVDTRQDLVSLQHVDINDAYLVRDSYHLLVLGDNPNTDLANWYDAGSLKFLKGDDLKINLKGTVPSKTDLIEQYSAQVDDAYITLDTYHLWALGFAPPIQASNWIDLGSLEFFKGKDGKDATIDPQLLEKITKLDETIKNIKATGTGIDQLKIDLIEENIRVLATKVFDSIDELSKVKVDPNTNSKIDSLELEIKRIEDELAKVQAGKKAYSKIVYSPYKNGVNPSGHTFYEKDGDLDYQYVGFAFNLDDPDHYPPEASSYVWADIGRQLYSHVIYSEHKDGFTTSGEQDFNFNKIGRYMGIRFNDSHYQAPSDPRRYHWIDRNSCYTWIAYASDDKGSDFSLTYSGQEYIGITVNEDSQTSSNVASDYKWHRFVGERGVDGTNGRDGVDAKPFYVHTVYSDFPNGIDVANDKAPALSKTGAYIGILTNSIEKDPPVQPSKYKWARLRGDKGDQGERGIPAPDKYTHVVYSVYEKGTNPQGRTQFTANHKTANYMGVLTNSLSSQPPNVASMYLWSKIKGEKGVDGKTLHTYFRYSQFDTGKDLLGNDSFTDDSKNAKFMGIAENVESDTAPTDASKYQWMPIGTVGAKGDKGDTMYMHLKFSNYPDGESSPGVASMQNTPKGMKYIGICYNCKTPVAPTEADDYFWYDFRGRKGEKGDTGASGTVHFVYSEFPEGKNAKGDIEFHRKPVGKAMFMGMRSVPEGTEYDLTDPNLYVWSTIRGTAGTSLYTHIGFSNYRSGVDAQSRYAVSRDYTGQRYILFNHNNPDPSFPVRPDVFGTAIDLNLMTGIKPDDLRKKIEDLTAKVNAGVGVDLTPLQTKINKIEADIAAYPDFTNMQNRLNDITNASSKNKADISELKVEDIAIKAVGTTLDTRLTDVERRINNLVVNAGNANTAEILTIKTELEDLKTKCDTEIQDIRAKGLFGKDLDKFKDRITKADTQFNALKILVEGYDDRITRVESAQGHVIKKVEYNNLLTEVRGYKTEVDKVKDEIKKTDAAIAGIVQTEVSKVETKLDAKFPPIDTEIQNVKQSVTDLDNKLSNLNITQPTDVTDLTDRVTTVEKTISGYPDLKALQDKINSLEGGASKAELQKVSDLLKTVINQLYSTEVPEIIVMYSPNKDGSNATDKRESNSKYIGFKVNKFAALSVLP